MADAPLRADLILEYPFSRTTGPVIGAFLTGLRIFFNGMEPDELATGMRVEVVWSDEREGHIADIAGFVPEEPS